MPFAAHQRTPTSAGPSGLSAFGLVALEGWPSVEHSRTNAVHLTTLTIVGFRGIERLSIPRLGRVTLLAGLNGVGKSTVLDAVRVFALRGDGDALDSLLESRQEVVATVDEDGDDVVVPDFSALFYGREDGVSSAIEIGSGDSSNTLRLEQTSVFDWPKGEWPLVKQRGLGKKAAQIGLVVEFQERKRLMPWNGNLHWPQYVGDEDWPPKVRCESLGPDLPDDGQISGFWDEIALTEEEEFATDAIKLALTSGVERVAVVGEGSRRRWAGRRIVVKLNGQPRPVPLKSLGDGAARLFSVALALANSRGGFLLIDEAENGIHYSVQPRFWDMVLRTAYRHDIQVLATTHSSDCIAGFAQAAMDNTDVEGTLVRLDRDEQGLRAVPYSEEGLKAAADQGIEVR